LVVQHGPAVQTCSVDMLHGQAAMICSMDILIGQALDMQRIRGS
jgi:hypothetical protein